MIRISGPDELFAAEEKKGGTAPKEGVGG